MPERINIPTDIRSYPGPYNNHVSVERYREAGDRGRLVLAVIDNSGDTVYVDLDDVIGFLVTMGKVKRCP